MERAAWQHRGAAGQRLAGVKGTHLNMVSKRVVSSGKFLFAGGEKFFPRGVSYGTFAPDARGDQYPPLNRIAEDFASMRRLGINTVRTYTVPSVAILDEAAAAGLRVMVGLPWSQHV